MQQYGSHNAASMSSEQALKDCDMTKSERAMASAKDITLGTHQMLAHTILHARLKGFVVKGGSSGLS